MGTKRIPEEKKILRVFFAQTRKPTKDEYIPIALNTSCNDKQDYHKKKLQFFSKLQIPIHIEDKDLCAANIVY